MNEVKKLLLEGETDRAMARFVMLMKHQPQQTGQVAKAMTATLLGLYDQFDIQPVNDFCGILPMSVPQPIANAMLSILGPMAERTRHWMTELEPVTRERLGREARAAVTTDDIKIGAQRGVALIGRGSTPEESRQLARFLVESLAELHRDHERAARVIKEVSRDGVAQKLGFDLNALFEDAKGVKRPAALEESNRRWTAALSGAIAAVVEYCPGRNEADEPTPENMLRFINEATALLRAGLARGREDDFIDALTILMEFSPTDPPDILSLVGVEPRMFLNLGPRARLTTVRGLAKIGENELLRKKVLDLARSPAGEGRSAMLSAIMGGLRHDDFYPFLKGAMKSAKTQSAQEPVVDALGRIANPGAVELLIDALAASMKKAVDPKEARRAKMLITALGRIGRSKGLDVRLRNKIVDQVIKCVGERFSPLTVFAASQMFTVNLQDLELPLRAWAAKEVTRAMFHRDTGEDVRAASRSPLGFRAPMAATLTRLGNACLATMLHEATPHASHYSGAFPAFAEVLQQAGDERAVTILDTMIRASFMDGGGEKDRLLKERVQDAATGEMRELNRDDIIHTLLFTLDKIGGESGQRIVRGYADQVQAGQLASPGQATSSFLVQMKRRAGSFGQREAPAEPEEKIDAKEIEKAFSQAKGGLLSNAKAQIMGLATLGRARQPETIPAVLSCLASKEVTVAKAAETALTHFVVPPPNPIQYQAIILHLFENKKLLRDPALERLINVISRSFPKLPPYDEIYRKHVSMEFEGGPEKFRLASAIALPKEAAPLASANGEGGEEGGERAPAEARLPTAEDKLDALQLKREYLEKRRAWIKSGKHGPAPAPPPGMA